MIPYPHDNVKFIIMYFNSEKASWDGCGGGRLKEGANINKSLVALSNVISALGKVFNCCFYLL